MQTMTKLKSKMAKRILNESEFSQIEIVLFKFQTQYWANIFFKGRGHEN